MQADANTQANVEPLYVYVIPPIDLWFGWKNLSKVQPDEIFPSEGVSSMLYKTSRREMRNAVDRVLYQGRKYAEQHLGYNGDIARGPFMSLVPGADGSLPIVAWGTSEHELTFVASPVPLPHLELLADEVVAIRAGERPRPEDVFGSFARED